MASSALLKATILAVALGSQSGHAAPITITTPSLNAGVPTTTESVNPAPAESLLATATGDVSAALPSIKLRRHEGFYAAGDIPELREQDDTRVSIERRQYVSGCYFPGEPGCGDSELRVEEDGAGVNISAASMSPGATSLASPAAVIPSCASRKMVQA